MLWEAGLKGKLTIALENFRTSNSYNVGPMFKYRWKRRRRVDKLWTASHTVRNLEWARQYWSSWEWEDPCLTNQWRAAIKNSTERALWYTTEHQRVTAVEESKVGSGSLSIQVKQATGKQDWKEVATDHANHQVWTITVDSKKNKKKQKTQGCLPTLRTELNWTELNWSGLSAATWYYEWCCKLTQ